jgi:ParB-like chromosome segregation protein Spo0J
VTIRSSADAGPDDASALPPAPDLLRDLPRQVVSIGDLMDALSPRERLEDPAHVRLLAEAESSHPPLVHRPTMRVIDGVHRLRAAVLNGQTEVTVQTFDGSEADAFVLAVELNVRHGLPSTLRERKAAAQRIISSHPSWSDRAIAERTGLSAKTVSKARRQTSGEVPELGCRIGRDGKSRPVSSVEGRRSAAALIAADPQLSLRELSRKTGVSVGTVRDVRKRLDRGQDPVPERLRDRGTSAGRPDPLCAGTVPGRGSGAATALPPRAGCPGAELTDTASAVQKLLRDPSLRATESGRRLLRLLVATELERSELAEIAGAVPAHWAHVVRLVALRRSYDWKQLAGQMAQKPEKVR